MVGLPLGAGPTWLLLRCAVLFDMLSAGAVSVCAFARPKPREPVGEEELFVYAVGSLARRMRSVRDLRRLMKPRAEPGEAGEAAMDRVIARLEELRYLSDERFAADFVRLRKENASHGRRRVQQDLAAKGVGKELVTTAVAAAFDDADELALVRRYAERKRLKPPVNEKETARVMGRLLRAGFGSTAIWKLLRGWRVEVDETAIAGADEHLEQAGGEAG